MQNDLEDKLITENIVYIEKNIIRDRFPRKEWPEERN